MNRRILLYKALMPAFSLIIGVGCAVTEPSRFYTLHSLSNSGAEQPLATGRGLAIGITPIKLPEFLDRPQIVTRISQNQLRLANFDRWAEPLADNFARILAENLSILLSTDRIAVFPWTKSPPIDFQVAVDVTQFEGKLGGSVSLIARWIIFGEQDKKALLIRKSTISEPTDAQGYEALVSAQGRALARLSQKIAAAIKTVSQKLPD